MEAAKAGDLELVQTLYSQNVNLLLYKGQGTNYAFTGHSALHWAAAKGNIEVCSWLLSKGANVHLTNNAGRH